MLGISLLLICATLVKSTPSSTRVSLTDSKSVSIEWYTPEEETSIVHYDDVQHSQTTSQLINKGLSEESSPEMSGTKYFHSVKLENLAPGKTYSYVAGSTDGWSGVKSFTAPGRKPTVGVLGNAVNASGKSCALEGLAEYNLAKRLDALILFSEAATPLTLLDILKSNTPTMIVPSKPGEDYYSVTIGKTYLIFLNTSDMNDAQESWLDEELNKAEDYRFILIFSQNEIPSTLIDGKGVSMHVTSGKNVYSRTAEIDSTVLVQQVPLGVSGGNTTVVSEGSSLTSAAPGYGLLHFSDAKNFEYVQYDTANHVVVDRITVQRMARLSEGEDAEYDDVKAGLYLAGMLLATLALAVVCKLACGQFGDSRLKEVSLSNNSLP